MAASEEAERRLTQSGRIVDNGGRSGIVQGLPYSLHHLEN
jgi:hypothetical protein